MQQRPVYALILRLGSALSFATMAMLVKYAAEQGLTLPQIIVGRQVVPVIVILLWLAAQGSLASLKTAHPGSHALRSGVGMIGMLCNFGSVMLLPLAEATTLGFSAPLFAVLIGSLIWREHIGRWRWTAVVLGFAGVLVIVQPGGHPIPLLGAIAGLGGGLVVAIVSYQIRELGRIEGSLSIVFYFSLFGSLLAAATLPLVPAVMPDFRQIALLTAVGFAGLLGQLFMTASLRHGAIASVIVMDYTALIWATVFGWAVWDNIPSVATWLGAPLIVAAGTIIAWREHRLARNRSPISATQID